MSRKPLEAYREEFRRRPVVLEAKTLMYLIAATDALVRAGIGTTNEGLMDALRDAHARLDASRGAVLMQGLEPVTEELQ